MKIWGPYLHKNGRMYVVIRKPNGKKGSMSLARFRMQQHLNRDLEKWEHVDHINGDYTDDRLDNLQILTQGDNNRKSAKRTMEIFLCNNCGHECIEIKSKLQGNHKFCNLECYREWRKQQI